MTPRRPSWTFRLALLSVAFLVGWSLLAFVQGVFEVRLPGLPRDESMLLAIIPIFAVAVGFAIVDIMSNTRIVAEHALGEGAPEPTWGRTLRRWTLGFLVGMLALGLVAVAVAKIQDHRARTAHREQMEAKARTIVAASQPLLDSLRVDTVTITRFREIVSALRFIAKSYEDVGRISLVFPCGVPGRTTLCELDSEEDLPQNLRDWQPPVEPVPYEPIPEAQDFEPCDGEGCLHQRDHAVRQEERIASAKRPEKAVPDSLPRWVPPPEPRVDLLLYPWTIELDLRQRLEASLATGAPQLLVQAAPVNSWAQVFAPLRLRGVRVYLAFALN